MPLQSNDTKLVFHIGDPKTGTTSIQSALRENVGQHGTKTYIAWPKANATDVANSLLGKKNLENQKKKREMQKWVTESTADYSVISSEFFGSVPPKNVKAAITEYLPNYIDNTRVIAYVRSHTSRFLAAYVQRTKTGMITDGVSDFLEQFEASNIHKYSLRFGRWEHHFPDQFTLRPFDRSRLVQQDIVTDFYQYLFSDDKFTMTKNVNDNTSLRIPALVGLQIAQRRLMECGVGNHRRSIFGGDIGNHFLPAVKCVGEKPYLDSLTVSRIRGFALQDAINTDTQFFDAPFLVPDLEKALDKASNLPMNLQPEHYFSKPEIDEIHGIAERMAEIFSTHGYLWTRHSQIRRGLYSPPKIEYFKILKAKRRLKSMDREIALLSNIIGCPEALAHEG